MFTISSARYRLIAACMAVTLDATAQNVSSDPNAAMRHISIGGQADDNHNSEATGAFSLTIGKHAWARGSIGSIRLQQGSGTSNPALWSLGGGVAGRQLAATVDFISRKDGDRYEQRDWNGTIEWHNDIWAVGIDGLHRDTEVRASVTVASGSDSASVPVAQSLRGNGAGLHVRFNAAGGMTLSAGGMRCNYSARTRQSGAATTTSGNGGLLDTLVGDALHNQPLLAQQLLVQPSGATREEAILPSGWKPGCRLSIRSSGRERAVFERQSP